MRERRLWVTGAVIAIVAEAASLALLGVSGWYLASCALAGLALLPGFAYPTPSGIVRFAAVTRVGSNFAARITLHRAVMAARARLRLHTFDAIEQSGLWRNGAALERAVVDVDQGSERALVGTVPALVSVLTGVGAVVVMGVAAPWSALALAVGLGVLWVVAATARGVAEPDQAPIRAELVAAIDGSRELASLGAGPVLTRTMTTLLHKDRRRRNDVGAADDRRALLAAAVGAATLTAIIATAMRAAAPLDLPVSIAHVVLATGVLATSGGLADLVRARGQRSASLDRLQRIRSSPPLPDPPSGTNGIAAPTPGKTVVITGPSGSGKTTALTAVVATFPGRAIAVAHDDFVFTGTVRSNFRLADPDVDDSAINAALRVFALDASITAATRVGAGGRALSAGEQRRVVIARAVAAAPDLLAIDEPDLALDAVALRVVLQAVRHELPSAALLFAMHHAPDYLEARIVPAGLSRQ